MTDNARQATLRRSVIQLLAMESELEAALDRDAAAMAPYAGAAAIARLREMTTSHRDALAAYLGSGQDQAAGPERTVVGSLLDAARAAADAGGRLSSSDAFRAYHAAFAYACVSYAALFEMALRLYDPELRELAPRHLREYAEAAQTLGGSVTSAVAGELARDGLECHCICPMCGMGACGCVFMGTATLRDAWLEGAPTGDSAPGFALQRPRPDSQLALAGIEPGDRLLEVDGRRVQTIPEIQTAIRRHGLGDEVKLVVQRGSEQPREIHVKHVSDYPQT